MRARIVLALPLLAAGLAACNQTAPSSSAMPAPAAVSLPAGAGCSASIARFRDLIDTDLATGHTTKTVHAQVTQEIAAASQLCASGNDAGARAAISASRSRHGYPAG